MLGTTWARRLSENNRTGVLGLIEQTESVQSLEQLKALLLESAQVLEAPYWQFCVQFLVHPHQTTEKAALQLGPPLHLNHWPDYWADQYRRQGYLECDPFILRNRLSQGAFQDHQQTKQVWQHQWLNKPTDPFQRQELSQQVRFLGKLKSQPGLFEGYSIGSVAAGRRWQGYWAVFYPKESEKKDLAQSVMSLLKSPLFESAQRQLSGPLTQPLTKRQVEVLKLLIRGYSKAQIGQQLGISIDTTAGHVKQIFSTFKVHKLSEVVGLATELKI